MDSCNSFKLLPRILPPFLYLRTRECESAVKSEKMRLSVLNSNNRTMGRIPVFCQLDVLTMVSFAIASDVRSQGEQESIPVWRMGIYKY